MKDNLNEQRMRRTAEMYAAREEGNPHQQTELDFGVARTLWGKWEQLWDGEERQNLQIQRWASQAAMSTPFR